MSTLPVACFGKLPMHREFLRIRLDSPGASWVVRWIESAHEAWTRTGNVPVQTPVVRFAAPAPGGRGVLLGVVRQSSDGLRRYPIAVFVEDQQPIAGARWPLVPIAAWPTWDALGDLALRSFDGVDAVRRALDEGAPGIDVAACDAAYRDALRVSPGGNPWEALAGVSGDAARHVAANFVTVAHAQRDARSAAEGISVAVRLPDAVAPAAAASLWMHLLAAALPDAAAVPVIVIGGDPAALVVFYRPPEGTDLAAVLTSLAMAPIDDIMEPWQELPAAGTSLAEAVSTVMRSGTLEELPDRVRTVMR